MALGYADGSCSGSIDPSNLFPEALPYLNQLVLSPGQSYWFDKLSITFMPEARTVIGKHSVWSKVQQKRLFDGHIGMTSSSDVGKPLNS